MKIKLTSITVRDQEKALKFYTETLGFVKKKEIPMGEPFRPVAIRGVFSDDDTVVVHGAGVLWSLQGVGAQQSPDDDD